jgi:hypothetical protein
LGSNERKLGPVPDSVTHPRRTTHKAFAGKLGFRCIVGKIF